MKRTWTDGTIVNEELLGEGDSRLWRPLEPNNYKRRGENVIELTLRKVRGSYGLNDVLDISFRRSFVCKISCSTPTCSNPGTNIMWLIKFSCKQVFLIKVSLK